MRNFIFNISIIIALFVLVITPNGDTCISNNVIRCYKHTYYTDYTYCTIYQNNADTISQAISSCSAGSSTELRVYIDYSVYSDLHSTPITITLNLANNIQKIKVQGDVTSPVYLTATQTNPSVSSIELNSLYIYNSGNLYSYFPNVTSFKASSVYFGTDFNFSTLKQLTYLYISCYYRSYNNITMDKEWVGGLSTLQYLRLDNCGIQNITTDAFSNLHSLTYLDLSYNNILELVPEVFRGLSALRKLEITTKNNYIKIPMDSKNNNAFSPLIKMASLDLRYTEIIPFDAFTTISSIQTLYLPKSSSVIVPSTLFQHLHNLKYLHFDDIPLVCNCSMQWASIVPKFGINVYGRCGGSCCDQVWDANLYTECGSTESYQCFNKSISCNYTCINTPDSYICAACDERYGLSQSEDECYDIDECIANNSLCEQKCRNTIGSYQCYCDSGYRLSADLISCTDIDECSQSSWNSCGQHQCLNEVGSYRCICDPGYQLTGDGYSCHDLDECSNASLNTCNQHTCINVLGTYTCICRQGYQLTTNGKNCEDIDECSCSRVESNSCGLHLCMNEQGTYRCIYDEGIQLNDTSSHDTDECLDANNSCNPHTCLNQVGSYTCSCEEGYQLATNGKMCEDIDECSLVDLKNCEPHKCQNEPGSFRCICDEGFQLAGNNISCDDTNECVNANNSCNPHTCLNLFGSYTCSCGEGYKQTSDGMSCEDIDECSLVQSNSCGYHQCMNELGSYRCICDEGFELAANNISCHDTDECMSATNSCNPHTCLNQVGSYTCLCGVGYQLATNGKTCEDKSTNASLPIHSADSAQSTGYSNGTIIIFVFLVIFLIITVTLLLLALLSIIIYIWYKKRKSSTAEKFEELPETNQSEEKNDYMSKYEQMK